MFYKKPPHSSIDVDNLNNISGKVVQTKKKIIVKPINSSVGSEFKNCVTNIPNKYINI